MKRFLLFSISIILCCKAIGGDKDSTIHYALPDSVSVLQFLAEIRVDGFTAKKEVTAGIGTDMVTLSLEADKKEKEIAFEFPRNATIKARGLNTDISEKGEIGWRYDWKPGETYKLLIAVATDSAENFSVYSGYAWLPSENKWKFVGTCRIEGQWTTIKDPHSFYSSGKGDMIAVSVGDVSCQRSNNSWKNMKGVDHPSPVINLFPHIDSVAQRQSEIKTIEAAINSGKIDTKDNAGGVYYKILQHAEGKPVSINDTVTVFYRVTLFSDGTFIDEAKDKPAVFPLKRLIKGWQIGIPLCKTGEKIRLVIPSDLAYSIRTRSPKIPPNSILIFEIEVVDTKPPL